MTNLHKGRRGRGKEISDVVRRLEGVLVCGVSEGCGGCHDVAVDVSAPAKSRTSSIGNRGNHILEVVLLDPVDLRTVGATPVSHVHQRRAAVVSYIFT